MKKILIASHGDLAVGLKSAATLIMGELPWVECLTAYLDGKFPRAQLEAFLAGVQADDDVFILTDLVGGSVNKEIAAAVAGRDIYLIAGVNLAMLLEVTMLNDTEPVDADFCRKLVRAGAEQIVFVNDLAGAESSVDGTFEEGL